MESALRAQRSRESRRKPERVLLCRPVGAQIVRTCEAPRLSWIHFEGSFQRAYLAGSLSNAIAVAREAVMRRSSPVLRNIIRMALGIWRWADKMPRRYQKRTKDAPDFRRSQTVGRIVPMPILGGLQHQYIRFRF